MIKKIKNYSKYKNQNKFSKNLIVKIQIIKIYNYYKNLKIIIYFIIIISSVYFL